MCAASARGWVPERDPVATDGQPGVRDPRRQAARTVGLYFMYDVKQADRRGSSPPWDARF